jgi:hypothetical protein
MIDKDKLKEKQDELLLEMFGGVRIVTAASQQPSISMDTLKRLGIGTKDDLKTSNKQLSESTKKKQAMKTIQSNINESIELAKEFGFENLFKKLNEINNKVNSKLLNS